MQSVVVEEYFLSIHPRGTMTFTTHITLKHRTRVAAGVRACVVGEDWDLGSSMRLMGSMLIGARSTK
jgi:hypothetical protein